MKPTAFDKLLATAVLEMTREPTVPATLDRVTNLVVDSMESCVAAAVLLVDGRPATVVASEEELGALVQDHVNREAAPAWTAHVEQEPVYCADLSVASMWPSMSEALTAVGIHSLYAVPLIQPARPLGALVAYAKTVDGFDDEDQETVRILAMHATAVLSEAVEQQQLQAALDSRTVIGQATGIIMERFSVNATAAFGVLRRMSQTDNVKLRDIATQVVDTGYVG